MGRTIMATTSAVSSASDIQMDYMKLLVTQLQNQDPLEPMDNNQMASQLTSLSSLSQLESMNSSFSKVLTATQWSYANSLLGKEVSFTDSANSTTGISSGVVSQVSTGTDGKLTLTVGTQTVALDSVLSVQNASTTTQTR
jgi:flagellar basal-body rod modification protein FlgD